MQLKSQKKIASDDLEYRNQQNLQLKLDGLLDELKALADQSIGTGKMDNVKNLVENPAQYLVETYRQLYLSNRPLHLDFNMIFENETSVKIVHLDRLQKEFSQVLSKMKIHSPTINAVKMTSNVKQENFNIYLDENKEKHYDLLNTVLKSLEALKEFQRLDGYFHIARAVNYLQMSNIGLEISVDYFKK
jgi:hypothetical protein